MKNIIKIGALALCASFIAVSCDLSEYNPNQPGDDRIYNSKESIQFVINGFYGSFGKVSNAYSKDAATDYFPAEKLSARFNADYDAAASSSDGTWGEWDDIFKYNYVLEQLNSSLTDDLSESDRKNFIGQVRLFRANKYYSMVKQYGDLPWYDHVIDPMDLDDEHKDRDSRDEIVKHVLEDYDYAIENITATSSDATCVTKEVAQFLKMRTCLYEASFRKYNNVTASVLGESFSNYTVNDLYQLASDTAEELINSGKYSLISNYRDLFLSETLQTKEVILGAQTAANVMGSQNNYFVYSKQAAPKTLTRTFVNTFLMKDGTPYTDGASYATDNWLDEFTDRDPRLALTVRYPGYVFTKPVVRKVHTGKYNDGKEIIDEYTVTIDTTVIPDFSASYLGYQIRKFCYDYYADLSGGDPDEKGGYNSNSTPIFRYAEVLLAYAEAKAELGEMDNSIWAATVGAIRKRAGITGSTLTTVPTTVDSYLQTNFYPNVTSAAIMEIRRERGVELCMEGVRQDDLIRWGCGNLLAEAPWDGIIIDALDTDLDLDGIKDNEGDTNPDVCFYTSKAGMSKTDGVVNVEVNGKSGLKAIAVGSKYQLSYPIDANLRYWAADNHLILDAIPSIAINDYETQGYTLTQNPGY